MSKREYPRPVLTVDVVVLLEDCDSIRHVLLIERGKEPFKGKLALPGGHFDVEQDESLYTAALRELEEETGLRLEHLSVLDIFDKKDRDPRGRYVSVAHAALLYTHATPAKAFPITGRDDAAKAMWVPITEVHPEILAFDHHDILTRALGWASRVDSSYERFISS